MHMQHALETIERLGQAPVIAEHMRRIAPTALEGINLRGTFDFPVAQYVSRLMPSTIAVPVSALAGAR